MLRLKVGIADDEGVRFRFEGITVEPVGSFFQVFTPELTADCETDSAGRQIEEIGGVNRGVQRRQLGNVLVFRMNRGEVDRGLIRRNRNTVVPERIKRDGGSDELR